MNKNKKLILIISIVLVAIILVIGVTYAAFSYSNTGSNQQLILGDIWMNYAESNSLTIEDAMPGADYTNYFEFTISGKNTYTKKDIWYEIVLTKGDKPDDKDENYRIPDEYIKFKLVSVDSSNQETEIFTDKKYGDLTNKRVHVETIPKNTPEVNKTYRLYMTIDNSLEIGNRDTAGFTLDEWEQAFASVKVNVTGDFNEKEISNEPGASETLKEVLKLRTNSYIEDEDGIIYISGAKDDNNPDTTDDIDFNYVWYSGKLWRITAIYPDGSMKMITENSMIGLNWGEKATVSTTDSTSAYSTSYVRQWLNQEFLPTLYNYENIINVDAGWYSVLEDTSSSTKPTGEWTVIDPVGLLNTYEYNKSYKKIGNYSYDEGYLHTGYNWWLMSLGQYEGDPGMGLDPSVEVAYVNSPYAYVYAEKSSDYYYFGIRPSINLKSTVQFVDGSGTSQTPYRIKGDIEEAKDNTTLLNTRFSGEYVKLEGDTSEQVFRIVDKELVGEKLTTKVVLNDTLKENGEEVRKGFSKIDEYWSDVDKEDTSYWRGYLNTTWLSTLNVDMLEKGTYYIGTTSILGNYKKNVCSSVNNEVSIKECINNGTVVSNVSNDDYVGLIRIGEILMGVAETYSITTTSNLQFKIRFGFDSVVESTYSPTDTIAARPTIHLTSTVVIKSGSGTEQDPFVVGLPA